MAITNYATLKTSIANWLARDDLTARIPEFIQLAESEMKRVIRRKTLRANITLDAYAVDLTQLPSFGELRSIHLVTSNASADAPIKIGSVEQLAEMRQQLASTGRPVWAAVVDTDLLLGPTPDDSYTAEATYFEALTALVGDTDTNSILTEAPDIYLWGALYMAAPYLEHDERIPVWEGRFNKGMVQLDTVREREESNASIRPIRLPVVYG